MSEGVPRIHVVLLNWNGWEETEGCLDSLLGAEYGSLAVTVVDNASTDGSPEHFERWLEVRSAQARGRFDLLRNDTNLGFAEGNNRGIARAMMHGADYVFVLNNDTVVEPSALGEMVALAETSGAAMVAPAVFDYARRDQVDRFGIVVTRSGAAYDRVAEDDGPLFCPSGCAALYRRDLVAELTEDPGGFFDRRFFIYNEDVDAGFRARARGHRAAFAVGAVIFHKGSATWGLGSPRSYYLRHRNTVWTVAKNYSAGLLLRESPRLVAGQLLGLFNAVRRRRFRAVLKGKWEGLLGAPAIRGSAPKVRTLTRDGLDRRFALGSRARIASDEAISVEGRALSGG